MQYTVKNDTPFQILTSAIVIGPSQTGYQLEVAADGKNFSPLFTVGANVTRQATNLSSGAYYRLNGNVGDVIVNWVRSCVTPGGSGGSGTGLSPVTEFPLDAEDGTVVAYNGTASASGVYQYTGEEWVPVGVDDLSAYWTSAQTQSAITIVEDHLSDVEQVTASALTELHDGIMEVSGRSVDLSNYYTSAQTEDAISAATSGKADKPLRETYPLAVSTLHINAMNYDLVLNGDYGQNIGDIWAPRSNGQAGQILVARGGQSSPVWSAMTFPTPDVDKAYVDSAITGVQNQINVMDEVVSDALNDLNDRIVELSGSSVDLSAYYTSAQTEDAISAATSGKADAASVTARGNQFRFPYWNNQGVITGETGQLSATNIGINGGHVTVITSAGGNKTIYAPTAAGTAGDILVSTGNGAPVWTTDNKVSSTSVSTIWKGTQAEYDSITTKDASTLYIIL